MSDTHQKWYYKIGGGHTHIRVFQNGKAGELCFTNEEFQAFKEKIDLINNEIEDDSTPPLIKFINEDEGKELVQPESLEMPKGKLAMQHILKDQPRLK